MIKIHFIFQEEIWNLVPEDMRNNHDNVIMGFLIKSKVSISNQFGSTDCYQPLHKTFLEFVAAYYLKSLAGDQDQTEFQDVLSRLQVCFTL